MLLELDIAHGNLVMLNETLVPIICQNILIFLQY